MKFKIWDKTIRRYISDRGIFLLPDGKIYNTEMEDLSEILEARRIVNVCGNDVVVGSKVRCCSKGSQFTGVLSEKDNSLFVGNVSAKDIDFIAEI